MSLPLSPHDQGDNRPTRASRFISALSVCARMYREQRPQELGPRGQVRPLMFRRWMAHMLSETGRPLLSVFEEAAEPLPDLDGWTMHETVEANLEGLLHGAAPAVVLGGVKAPGLTRMTLTALVRDEQALHLIRTVGYPAPGPDDNQTGAEPTYDMDQGLYSLRQLFDAIENNILTSAEFSPDGEPMLTRAEEQQYLQPFLKAIHERVVNQNTHPAAHAAFKKLFNLIANLLVDPPGPNTAPHPSQDETHHDGNGQPAQGGFV